MLCDGCIKQLAVNLSKESRQILVALETEPLNFGQIVQKAKLSYAVAQRAINELAGSLFVSFQDVGRSKVFSLSDSGRRLLEIYKKERGR